MPTSPKKTPANLPSGQRPPVTSSKTTTKKANSTMIAHLRGIVEDLKSQLADQLYENVRVEAKVREEVYNRYVKWNEDLKRRYSDQKREAVEVVEDLAEFRIELFKKYSACADETEIAPQEDSSDDEYEDVVPAAVLKDVQEQLKGKELECQQLRKEIDDLKGTSAIAKLAVSSVESLEDQARKKDRRITDLEALLEEAGGIFRKMQREKKEILKELEALKAEKASWVLRAVDVNENSCVPNIDEREVDFVDVDSDEEDRASIVKTPPTTSSGKPKRRRSPKKAKRVSLSINSFRKRRSPLTSKKIRFDQMVKMNRAYMLKRGASPHLRHDHGTGLTFAETSATKPGFAGMAHWRL